MMLSFLILREESKITENKEPRKSKFKENGPDLEKMTERLYFPVKTIFLTKFNTFSMFYLDFEFKKLKKNRTTLDNLNPEKIFDDLQISKINSPNKIVKLTEELLLSLSAPNEFLYSQGHYQPAKLLKSNFDNDFLNKI